VQSDNEDALKLMRGVPNLDGRSMGSQTELWIELPPKRGIGSQLAHVLRVAAATPFGGQSPIGWVSPSTPAPTPRPWLSIRTVVVGSDGSASANVAVQAAADLAGRFAAVLHVVSAYRESEERTAALAALAAAETDLAARGLKARCHARRADTAAALADVAAAHSADVIVVGSKGLTGPAWLLGSVPSAISRRAACSVMIVRTG
jgi:nucleotide-binding universal stress UspA family protein